MRLLHPPGTGGNSLAQAWGLAAPEYLGHAPYAGESFAVCLIRNPFDRAVSLWGLLAAPGVEFAEWVAAGMTGEGDYEVWPPVLEPQHFWAQHAHRLIRYENRDVELRALAMELGRPDPTSVHVRALTRPRPEMDAASRATILDRWRIDFETYYPELI